MFKTVLRLLVQKENIDSSLLMSTSSAMSITLETTQRQLQEDTKVEREKQNSLGPRNPRALPNK